MLPLDIDGPHGSSASDAQATAAASGLAHYSSSSGSSRTAPTVATVSRLIAAAEDVITGRTSGTATTVATTADGDGTSDDTRDRGQAAAIQRSGGTRRQSAIDADERRRSSGGATAPVDTQLQLHDPQRTHGHPLHVVMHRAASLDAQLRDDGPRGAQPPPSHAAAARGGHGRSISEASSLASPPFTISSRTSSSGGGNSSSMRRLGDTLLSWRDRALAIAANSIGNVSRGSDGGGGSSRQPSRVPTPAAASNSSGGSSSSRSRVGHHRRGAHGSGSDGASSTTSAAAAATGTTGPVVSAGSSWRWLGEENAENDGVDDIYAVAAGAASQQQQQQQRRRVSLVDAESLQQQLSAAGCDMPPPAPARLQLPSTRRLLSGGGQGAPPALMHSQQQQQMAPSPDEDDEENADAVQQSTATTPAASKDTAAVDADAADSAAAAEAATTIVKPRGDGAGGLVAFAPMRRTWCAFFLEPSIWLRVIGTALEEAYIAHAPALPEALRAPVARIVYYKLRGWSLPLFDATAFTVIVGNAILLGCTSSTMTAAFAHQLRVANYFFTGCFCLELAMRIIAAGGARTFLVHVHFARFDAFVIVMSLVSWVFAIVLLRRRMGAIF